MDYEKKYKEALELARVAAFNGHQSLMEGIFPELAESKDEKISKEIIKYLEQTVPHHHHDEVLKSKEWIAWLENIPYTIDHEKREGFHLGYKAALEKQGEQKPAWSCEDETRLQACLDTLQANSLMGKVDTVMTNWLKSLKNRIKGE